MVAQARRRRLIAAMAESHVDGAVLYGNAWQGDYLRYAADFGILEGHGIAVMLPDGTIDLFLDSATEAERAETEVPGATIHFEPDIARAVAARLERMADRRLLAAPRRFLPNALVEGCRSFALEDGTALLDRLLMHKMPEEIETVRRAAEMADDAYAAFRAAVRPGRRQYEIVAEIERYLRSRGCPDNFMIIGSGGKDVLGMTLPPNAGSAPAISSLPSSRLQSKAISSKFAARWWWERQARRSGGLSQSSARRSRPASRQCVPRPRPPTWRAPRTRCFANMGSGIIPPASGRACADTDSACFANSKPHLLEEVETPLVPGMALIVHPNTYHPEAGYMVLGDAVVVTDAGAEVLSKTPRELFEVV